MDFGEQTITVHEIKRNIKELLFPEVVVVVSTETLYVVFSERKEVCMCIVRIV